MSFKLNGENLPSTTHAAASAPTRCIALLAALKASAVGQLRSAALRFAAMRCRLRKARRDCVRIDRHGCGIRFLRCISGQRKIQGPCWLGLWSSRQDLSRGGHRQGQ